MTEIRRSRPEHDQDFARLDAIIKHCPLIIQTKATKHQTQLVSRDSCANAAVELERQSEECTSAHRASEQDIASAGGGGAGSEEDEEEDDTS